jgi:hypothetical protein
MNIKEAKNLIDEILDLCSQIEDPILTESAEGIYRDVQAAKTVEHVIQCASELMIFINETPWDDYDASDIRMEIERIYDHLQEDYEDFV